MPTRFVLCCLRLGGQAIVFSNVVVMQLKLMMHATAMHIVMRMALATMVTTTKGRAVRTITMLWTMEPQGPEEGGANLRNYDSACSH